MARPRTRLRRQKKQIRIQETGEKSPIPDGSLDVSYANEVEPFSRQKSSSLPSHLSSFSLSISHKENIFISTRTVKVLFYSSRKISFSPPSSRRCLSYSLAVGNSYNTGVAMTPSTGTSTFKPLSRCLPSELPHRLALDRLFHGYVSCYWTSIFSRIKSYKCKNNWLFFSICMLVSMLFCRLILMYYQNTFSVQFLTRNF